MDFGFTPEEEAFQTQVSAFVRRELPPERRRQHLDYTEQSWVDGDLETQFRKSLSASGLLSVGWPREYGGGGKKGAYNAVLAFELARAWAPGMPPQGMNIVGPSLMVFGSEEQRRHFLPRIVRGEIEFCLGYSEPGAGSDLAAIQTRATEDGDDFIINGQKIFTTGAHRTEYTWMVARTNPNVPKHKGISLFLVPMATPGITVRPLWTMSGWRHNEVFFDNVRVPRSTLVGEKDRGWYHLAIALDFERNGFVRYGEIMALLDDLVAYCKTTARDGHPLSRKPRVRQMLAELRTDLDVGMRLSKRIIWMQSQGLPPNAESSMNKIWASELIQRVCHFGTQIMGLYGCIQPPSPHQWASGRITHGYLDNVRTTVSAGSNEIQRNVIAQRGLGLPRGE